MDMATTNLHAKATDQKEEKLNINQISVFCALAFP